MPTKPHAAKPTPDGTKVDNAPDAFPYQPPGLTEQELEVARSARFDLGAGYPQFPVPEFIRLSYRDDRLEDLSQYRRSNVPR